MTMEQKTPEVRMTIEGHICVISLDNTSKKNAITPDLMAQLSTHLTTFEDDDLMLAGGVLTPDVLGDEQLGQARLAHPRGAQHQRVPDALAQRQQVSAIEERLAGPLHPPDLQ